MAVTTKDVLIEGARRDTVFRWLSDPANHRRILEGAFQELAEKAPGEFELTLCTKPRRRVMGYRIVGPDDSHGGRRVLVETTGRRTRGELHYSLRTMKPSTNTLVTLRMDYDPGSILGPLVDNLVIRRALEDAFAKVLDNLRAATADIAATRQEGD